MEELTKSELKAVLFSKRANVFYLEKCRVMQKDGRVLYLTEGKKANQYYNIPIANTTVITRRKMSPTSAGGGVTSRTGGEHISRLVETPIGGFRLRRNLNNCVIMLGTGTSITQAAMRMLAGAGVLVGFCGGGGTPLFAGAEIEWLSPQSEYRPTQYVQGWLSFWFDEEKRLLAAKTFQQKRCSFLERVWNRDRDLQGEGFYTDDREIEGALKGFRKGIETAGTVTELLTAEANFAKQLYKYSATQADYGEFTRDKGATDVANIFLNHGNYLAYGMAASALWVLGIPHGFAVMHGKTRRGALVFDVADLIKDAIVLPGAFICASVLPRSDT